VAGSVAIVTGASSGLGLELALRMAERRAVVGVSRRAPTDARWRVLEDAGSCRHVAGDVAETDTTTRAFAEADRLGRLDVVVNCAGVGRFAPAGGHAPGEVADVIRSNVVGLIAFSETAYGRFSSAAGTIVNVLSTAAFEARPGEAVYCASKWAARGYTLTLQAEAKGSPVRVIAVYPGGMATAFWDRADRHPPELHSFLAPASVAERIVAAMDAAGGALVDEIVIRRGPAPEPPHRAGAP